MNAPRLASLVALPLLVALAAGSCGGSVVIVDAGSGTSGLDTGDDGSRGAGAGGTSPGTPAGGSSSGYVGAGSSSSGPSSGSSGVVGLLGSSGTQSGMCTSAAGCPSGEVCCATAMVTTVCQAPPCLANTPLGAVQLCSSSDECYVHGDVCGPLPIAINIPVMMCQAPSAVADAAPPPCSTATCAGCCDMYGVCVSGAVDNECGTRGTASPSNAVIVGCQDCTLTGQVCQTGTCR